MPQPTPYVRSFSFTDFSASFPSVQHAGYRIDADFDAVAETLEGTLANLALIQRDDGALANETVHLDTFGSDAIAAFAAVGVTIGPWLPATAYVQGAFIFDTPVIYLAVADYTSGATDANDDYLAGDLIVIFDPAGLAAVTGLATALAAGLMSAAQFTKLLGIATGATANSSDAVLLARANHTGTQAQATIDGLVDALATIAAAASIAETNTGTDAAKFVTPDGLAGSSYGTAIFQLQLTDPNGAALATGDGKGYFIVPAALNGWDLVTVAGGLTTVSSSGIPTFQVANVTDGVDMLSTKLTIDANELHSKDATTPAVIDTTKDDVATGDLLRIDCDVAGTGAKGAMVILGFRIP